MRTFSCCTVATSGSCTHTNLKPEEYHAQAQELALYHAAGRGGGTHLHSFKAMFLCADVWTASLTTTWKKI